MRASLCGKVVMVTGAGGVIGRELCRQVLLQQPQALILLDIAVHRLVKLEQELMVFSGHQGLRVPVMALVGTVQNRAHLQEILMRFGVQTIFHSAIHSDERMVERNVVEGLRNNVLGTEVCARAARAAEVETLVLVSTDGAARPINVMQASMRLAEQVCETLAAERQPTRFSVVRVGRSRGAAAGGGAVEADGGRHDRQLPVVAQRVIHAGATAPADPPRAHDIGECEVALDWPQLRDLLDCLKIACRKFDFAAIQAILEEAPIGYRPVRESVDLLHGARRDDSVDRPDTVSLAPAPADRVVALHPKQNLGSDPSAELGV
ncbi:polysaccharide biosynthesis protein [Halomonas kalidii]|uniref:Polysaccharide biosynthesis protein n=1 Tax=Halomonas kalidii TaxID=3043293 RepID=A0ABT6VK41_9GAMM|nr:polysaccharide biosynthesis protein [Halomonas kalidii]MDI5934343.1 polysaccharide biosynthesis protein [Halomonas kalidii]